VFFTALILPSASDGSGKKVATFFPENAQGPRDGGPWR
jgi:hypothetical protein